MTLFLEKLLPQVVWENLLQEDLKSSEPDSDPAINATHKGILKIDDFELQCYKCSNGEVAFDIEDLERFLRGCHLCDHPSRCPACNPSAEERNCPRIGLMVSISQSDC